MMNKFPVWSDIAACYRGKRVLVTGHTGFKGSWLCEWLLAMGAQVSGYSVDIPTSPALFTQIGLADRLGDTRGDIRDANALGACLHRERPDLVFHLAAQSLVRRAYAMPAETFDINVMGTVNVLDCIRHADWNCALVAITSDKCYENREWHFGYREIDPMGGFDPYSASKGCAELVLASYRRSFARGTRPMRLASGRAGNVIGGGDWAPDRVIPDAVRALRQAQSIPIRNPYAVRPWQHVLEPVGGYLRLGYHLLSAVTESNENGSPLNEGAFNFGPRADATCTVRQLIEHVLALWPGRWTDCSDPTAPHEASVLMLAVEKARSVLGWSPVWSLQEAVRNTVAWYQAAEQGDAAALSGLMRQQINSYTLAADAGRA